MSPEERAAKRAVMVQGMVARGYTKERAEELLNEVGRALFGPGGRFATAPSGEAAEPTTTDRGV